MINELFRISVRRLFKDKGYSFVNVVGLTLGISCALFLYIYINDELSYDRYHSKGDHIYRVTTHVKEPGNEFEWNRSQFPLAEALSSDYPEVQNAVRFFTAGRELFENGETKFYEERFYYTDSSVFKMFDYDFIAGDPATALQHPLCIVLTESIAIKFFGSTDILNETLLFVDRKEQYKVTGVMKDVPGNSHFQFDALMSGSSLPVFRSLENWSRLMVHTYLELPENYDPDDLEPKLDKVAVDHVAPLFAKRNIEVDYNLQRITDIHLRSNIQDEEEAGGDLYFVYLLGAIATMVVGIACINYINLTTARYAQRAREVGVRKIMGSLNGMLITQFMIEAFIQISIALLASVAIVVLLMPFFNYVAGKNLLVGDLFNWRAVPVFIGALFLLGVCAGLYPAIFLSRLNPVSVIHHRGSPRSTAFTRKMLVVIQFSISVFLITATMIVYDQLRYLANKDLGFNHDQVMRINIDDSGMRRSLDVFRNLVLQDVAVKDFGTATSSPGENVRKAVVHVENDDGSMGERSTDWFMVDFGFVPAIELNVISGRSFDPFILSDTMHAVMVNEAMVKRMNWKDPIGKKFQADGPQRKVIGVIKDYHQNSLYDEIEPVVILFRRNNDYSFIKLSTDDLPAAVARIGKAWSAVYPGKPFEFQFLDQAFNAQYDVDQRRSVLFSVFSVIALVIACLGLLGLIAFSTTQRSREIGIRKVNGAGVADILMLVSKDFIWLIAIATAIALPITAYVMDKWLQEFAYRIELSGEGVAFVLSAAVAFLITMLTISWHATKAAMSNPVESLRSE